MTAPAVPRRWREPSCRSIVEAAVRGYVVPLRRSAPLAALFATGLVLQAVVAPHLAVAGMAPDVLLVAVVTVAAGWGERSGAAFGFAAGLGADLFLATPLGTSALAYTLVGHMVGRSSRPPTPKAASALCSPDSACFACRHGRRHREVPAAETATRRIPLRRGVIARRAALRRSILLIFLGVLAGRLATAAVATVLGAVTFPAAGELARMPAVAALSVPLGPAVSALARSLGRVGARG